MRRLVTASVLSVLAAAIPSIALASPGDVAWHVEVDGSAHSAEDFGTDVVVAASGDRVFLVGNKDDGATGSDGFVGAYDASTGAVVWFKRYDSPTHRDDWFKEADLSPNGDVLYVLGGTQGRGSDALVVAFSANSGKKLWSSLFQGPKKGDDGAQSLAVDRSGRRVYIGGWGSSTGGFAAAFSASGGPPLWVWKAKGYSWIYDVAAAPGGRVLVAGENNGDAFLGAFKGRTGARVWSVSKAGSAGAADALQEIAVAPDGAGALAVGELDDGAAGMDSLIVKVDLATGAVPWFKINDSAGDPYDKGRHVAVSGDSSTFFVAESHGNYPSDFWNIRSYAADDGAPGWTAPVPGAYIESMVVGSDGNLYTVGGSGPGYRLNRFVGSSGANSWSVVQTMTSGYALAIAMSADAGHAFVTGIADGNASIVSLSTT